MSTTGNAPTEKTNGAATTALAPATAPPAAPGTAPPAAPVRGYDDDPAIRGTLSAFASSSNFEAAQRIATALAKSTMVPKAYQNNIPNCLVAMEMAGRIGSSVMAVMQNMVPIYGKPSWQSTFLIATVNASRKFKSSLKYKFEGEPNTDSWGCRAWARDLDGDICMGSLVTIKMAKDEGWYTRTAKDGGVASKWPNMPEQMLMYRAAAFWTRVYAPELSLGMHTVEEVEDFGSNDPINVGPVGGGLAPVPHADAANTGHRMSLGKPNVKATEEAQHGSAGATPIQDAVIVPATKTDAATAGADGSGPPAVDVGDDDDEEDDRGDAPTTAELEEAARGATRSATGQFRMPIVG